MIRVLLVDDHGNVRRSMALVLEHEGMAVREAASAAEALALLSDRDTDVLVTDVRLDRDADGTALLRAIEKRDPEIEVIPITAFGTIDQAVDAIKSGAYEYLTKPVDPGRLAVTVRRAAERRALSSEVRLLRAEIGNEAEIIARSAAMQGVVREAVRLADSDSTVLITGESGTGKEIIARLLYLRGNRRAGKFVPINCGALPKTILESELFGYQKGAFTGALADRKGLLEEAHKGVLFLDELGEIPHAMQVRLLRFMQDGEVRPVSGAETRRVDVRLVGGDAPVSRRGGRRGHPPPGLLLPDQRDSAVDSSAAGASRGCGGAGRALPASLVGAGAAACPPFRRRRQPSDPGVFVAR